MLWSSIDAADVGTGNEGKERGSKGARKVKNSEVVLWGEADAEKKKNPSSSLLPQLQQPCLDVWH